MNQRSGACDPTHDLNPLNRAIIEQAWAKLAEHIATFEQSQGNEERQRVLDALSEYKQATFVESRDSSASEFSRKRVVLTKDLGDLVVCWPLHAFRVGLDLLWERNKMRGYLEGSEVMTIMNVMANFQRILESGVSLKLQSDGVSKAAQKAVTKELETLGWYGTWMAKLDNLGEPPAWAGDSTNVTLHDAGRSYGETSVALSATELVHITQEQLGNKMTEPFERWLLKSEAYELLTSEAMARTADANELRRQSNARMAQANALQMFALRHFSRT